jgi:hypothetical protein
MERLMLQCFYCSCTTSGFEHRRKPACFEPLFDVAVAEGCIIAAARSFRRSSDSVGHLSCAGHRSLRRIRVIG